MKRLAIAAVLSLVCITTNAQTQNQPTLETAARVVRLLDSSGYQYTKLSPSVWSITFKGEKMPSVAVLVIPVSNCSRPADEELVVEGVVALHDEVASPSEVMRLLLKLNGTGTDVTFLLDEDNDYVARGRYVLGVMDNATFKSSLEAVAVATDDAYGVVKLHLSSGTASSTSTYRVPTEATQKVEILNGKASVSVNPKKWKETKSAEAGRQEFQHVKGDGYAMVISERIQVPIDQLRKIAFGNVSKEANDARVVEEQHRRVNGIDVLLLRIEGTISGIPFTYLGYYYGGAAGTVQVITYTGQNLFKEYRKDFEEFLNGFRLEQ
jgi:hypothetical protein